MSDFNAKATAPAPDPEDPDAVSARPRPAKTFSVPVPVSDNAADDGDPAVVGATRPALGLAPYTFTKSDGTTGNGAWVAYGYEETTPGLASELDPEQGKRVIHHAFDVSAPDVDSAGQVVSPPGQSARRVRYLSQPLGQLGGSRTAGALIYRMGTEGHSGSADFMMNRFAVPAADLGTPTTSNPFRVQDMQPATNVSATTPTVIGTDPVTGTPRVTEWIQTPGDLEDGTGESPLESARGHRGMLKGDFLALGYLWTPNGDLFMQGRDIENYYVRRSFDGGATFTSAPATAPYLGDGVRSCRYFNDSTTGALRRPVCQDIGPGQFEPAQNLTRLAGFDESAIEPRLQGLPGSIPGSPYPEDQQDPSVVWQAWGTALPKGADVEEGDPDVPVPDEGSGKAPLDVYYTFSRDYGDTYYPNDLMAGGPSVQAESQLRFSPDGSKRYAVWNDYGPGAALDVEFRRFLPDAFDENTSAGALALSDEQVSVREGGDAVLRVHRVVGRRGTVTVSYHTEDGTARAGQDYEPRSGQLVFEQGDIAPQAIVVPTEQDAVDAPDVSFKVVLDGFEGVAEGFDPQQATVRIVDDEDVTPPRSRSSSPWLTNQSVIPVTYSFSDRESGVARVTLYVKGPGAVAFRRAGADPSVDGRMSYPTDGRNGLYRFYTVARDAPGNLETTPLRRDSRTRLDTVRPAVRAPKVGPRPFDISRDRAVRMAFRAEEPVTARFVLRRAGGARVRTFPAVRVPAGVVRQRWAGRDDSGAPVTRGRYVATMRATDAAGNVRRRSVEFGVRR